MPCCWRVRCCCQQHNGASQGWGTSHSTGQHTRQAPSRHQHNCAHKDRAALCAPASCGTPHLLPLQASRTVTASPHMLPSSPRTTNTLIRAAYRKLAGKELAEDATFELERKRNRPEKYDREVGHTWAGQRSDDAGACTMRSTAVQ